jgi:hypothetical protein
MRLLATICLLLAAPLAAEEPPAARTGAPETIAASRDGRNGRSWRAAFDLELTPDRVAATLRLRLVPGPGVTRPRLERWRRSWEEAVERRWSGCVALLVHGAPRPITLDVRFVQVDPHHTVVVKEGDDRGVDQLHWSLWSSEIVVAHEVGHMLGAYDEYPGGGQDPAAPSGRPGSLMSGSPSAAARCEVHHLAILEPWARERIGTFRPVALEPDRDAEAGGD